MNPTTTDPGMRGTLTVTDRVIERIAAEGVRSQAGHNGRVTASSHPQLARQLRSAIVLGTTEDECSVVVDGRARMVPFAPPFPRPRTDRVAPGHLVAIAASSTGSELIVWRWFDAVVIAQSGTTVTMWEPFHGTVTAQSRDPRRCYPLGSRAYASAGLPGAEWWIAGPTTHHTEDADVELDEVDTFFTDHGLWDAIRPGR